MSVLYTKRVVENRPRVPERRNLCPDAQARTTNAEWPQIPHYSTILTLFIDAVRYYRSMYYSGNQSWDLRDTHMFETLVGVLKFRGAGSKAVLEEGIAT